jgi:hypothetical protein
MKFKYNVYIIGVFLLLAAVGVTVAVWRMQLISAVSTPTNTLQKTVIYEVPKFEIRKIQSNESGISEGNNSEGDNMEYPFITALKDKTVMNAINEDIYEKTHVCYGGTKQTREELLDIYVNMSSRYDHKYSLELLSKLSDKELFEGLPGTTQVSTDNIYTQNGILSFIQSYRCSNVDYGGEYNGYQAFMYDLTTGKPLGLKDLFEGFDKPSIGDEPWDPIVNKNVMNILRKHYKNEYDNDEEGWKDCRIEVSSFPYGDLYIVNAAKLGFVFERKNYGPCSNEITIPISELRPYFKKDGVLSRIK